MRFNPVTERFDDSAVVGFLADKDVISINDHFFLKDSTWKALLAEEDWPLFQTLRAWRGERLKQEGIPPT